MKQLLLVPILVCTLLIALPQVLALASGGSGTTPARSVDPDFALAQKAIDSKEYGKAAELLKGVVARDSRNADAHNLLGYAERQRGNLDGAFRAYEQALAINPKHRGAHEYLGEAYLMVGNLAKAQEHLTKLDKLCFFSCAEYRDLKQAIADYQTTHPAK